MIVTDLTKKVLGWRRRRRELLADGFEEITESGRLLGHLNRGHLWNHVITAAVVGPEGKSVFIKTERQ